MGTNDISTAPLGELVTRSDDWITLDPTEVYTEVTVRLWGKGVIARGEKLGGEIGGTRRLRVHPHEFILSRIDARNGAFGLVPAQLDGAVVSNDFPCFRANESALLPDYLGWLSRTRWFTEACKQVSEGTTNRVRLNEEKFLAIEIPLPPIEEQRRIVAKIEHLAGKVDHARGLRTRSLKETNQWMASIAHQLFAEELAGRSEAIPLGDISDVRSGVTLGRQLSGELVELPYLRVANVQDGYLDLNLLKTVWVRSDERDKWQLRDGDLLLTEGGDWDKLGRGTVWREEIADCIHQNHIFRVRLCTGDLYPEYVLAVIRSPYGKDYFKEASKKTTNLASINQRQLKAFPVFSVPLEEQREIVAYLNGLQDKVDRLKAVQQKTAAELDALLPSILDKAFKGEL